jgi:ATP-binding cassette, subfamily C, bacterial LapB
MKELMRRFMLRPAVAVEILVGSLFVNVLAMASPLFVMQILNRYVGQGVDATLYTLTSGVLIAIVLEFAFRQSRLSLARGISALPDEATAFRGFDALTRAKVLALDQTPPETRKEIINGTTAIETAYSASNIATILDAPFSLLFIFVLYILEPKLAYVAIFFVGGVFLIGVVSALRLQEKTQELQGASSAGGALLGTVIREADTVRSFNAGEFLRKGWHQHIVQTQKMRRDFGASQGLMQTVTQSANGLMSVAVVAVGATLVVLGDLNVGAMIGGNILAARALQPVTKLAQLGSAFMKARQSLNLFKKLATVEFEANSGSALRAYSGRLELRDVAFAYPGSTVPIFESLDLDLKPGSVLVVTGDNGTGKSTMARLLLGLLDPVRGQILVDGLDMKQISPEWWRRQVVFLPQEPGLLNATIEQNLCINNPEMDSAQCNQVVDQCGLRNFLNESPDGFETMVTDNGWRLSEGIRRRVALGRALSTDGMIAILDEPTESLDADGCKAVNQILGTMVEKGNTIIVMSHNRNIVKGPHLLLDLNIKPVPGIKDAGIRTAPETQILMKEEPPTLPSLVAIEQPAKPDSVIPEPANPIPEISGIASDIPQVVPSKNHDVSEELGVDGIRSRLNMLEENPDAKQNVQNGNGEKAPTPERVAKK